MTMRNFRITAWLAAAALCAPAAAQDLEPFATGADGLYSLPRSQDEIAEWQQAQEEIAANQFEPAVERLNRLLRDASQGVVPVIGTVDRWIGLRLAVLETLRDLPPEGRELYERLARLEAGPDFVADPRTLSHERLEYLAQRYPTSSAGVRARVRLSDLALEAGDGIDAQQYLRAALDCVPAIGDEHRGLVERAQAARLLVLSSAGVGLPDDAPMVDALRAALPGNAVGGWPAYGGGLDGSRQMTPPVGTQSHSWQEPMQADGFDLNEYPMHAIGDLSGILLDDGQSVWCLDPLRQETAWVAPGPMVGSDEIGEARGQINPDLILACATSPDVVVAALQVPIDVVGAARTQTFRNTISIIEKIPARRLFAFDRATGKRLWAHFDRHGGPITKRFHGQDACGAPIIQGDTVYCATHDQTGAIAFYISAYDLHTGEPRWRRLICTSQQEVNMFGNAQQEFAAGPIALVDGMVVGTTNLGVCFAVDAEDGRIRWITGYPTIPLPRTQLRDQERRPVFFANNPIVVTDGVMATTPLDSEYALGLDIQTGEMQWKLPFEINGRSTATIRWLLGAIGKQFVFSGLGIVAVEAHGEGQRPRVSFVANAGELGEDRYRANAIPRGAIAGNRIYYVGTTGTLTVLDLLGHRDPKLGNLPGGSRGNLLLIDGLSVFVQNGSVEIDGDLDSLVRDARAAVDARPDDPVALLRLATLERALLGKRVEGNAAERVEAIFEAGLKSAHEQGLGSGSRVYSELAQGLFRISLERAIQTADDAPARAIALLERARERAVQPAQWLRAQQEIVELCSDDAPKMLAELDLMARRYGRETYPFRGAGRVPVSVYALVRSIPYLQDPSEAAERCQLLMDRYGDVEFASRPIREIASQTLSTLIEKHGREIYAPIEARAVELLKAAGDDAALLRHVVDRFPQSAAARVATQRLLETAVASGDLGVAAAAFRDAVARGALSAGVLRRMIVSAVRAGNLGLAHALGTRLVAAHGDEPSDYAPDAGARYADLIAALPPAPQPSARPAELPVTQLAFLEPTDSIPPPELTDKAVVAAAGFREPARIPLAISVDGAQLLVFDLERGLPKQVGDARISVPIEGLDIGPLFVCGNTLVVTEVNRVRGIDWKAGLVSWTYDPGRNRRLKSLGMTGGVLHLYSNDTNGGDRHIVGLEPDSGAVLFENEPPGWRDGAEPQPAAGLLWQFDARGDGDGPLIREIDPVLGTTVGATPLTQKVLASVGLTGSASRRLYVRDIQTGFTADDHAIYFPVEPGSPEDVPRLVALARGSGKPLWDWSGATGAYVNRIGVRDGRVVLFERGGTGVTARLLVLDAATGDQLRTLDFGEQAVLDNWPASPWDHAVPETLLVRDRTNAPRISCVSLGEAGPNFRYPLPNVARILQQPILGDGYLLIPLYRQGRRSPLIKVLDLATRRGALPGGSDTLTLDAERPVTVHAHDGLLVVSSQDGIRLLGSPRR